MKNKFLFSINLRSAVRRFVHIKDEVRRNYSITGHWCCVHFCAKRYDLGRRQEHKSDGWACYYCHLELVASYRTHNWVSFGECRLSMRSAGKQYFHSIPTNSSSDRTVYEASCIWTTKRNHVSNHRSFKVVSGTTLRLWKLCRKGVTASIPLLGSMAEKCPFECSIFVIIVLSETKE